VTRTNSLLAICSNWLNFNIKQLLRFVKSYTKESTTIIKELKKILCPPGALLFTADATLMYTNIDTHTGIAVIENFINAHLHLLPSDYRTHLILQMLRLIMDNNVFSFMETYWLQLTGTAMGTPVACVYATITFGNHENTEILTTFQPNLVHYKRYNDDILGIWLPPRAQQR
jgi:hypothetical protein